MNAPVLIANLTTYEIMSKFEDFTPKLNSNDVRRVTVACDHVCEHINFEELERQLRK